MRLATIGTTTGTSAARIEGDRAIPLCFADVGSLLASGGSAASAEQSEEAVPLADATVLPVVTAPAKILCVGLNFRTHILEMGREIPEYPTIFAKFSDTLIGAVDDLVLPSTSTQVDWEAELAVIIGRSVRRANPDEARAAIAGYTVANDVSMRDWQWRTTQWLQGKAFDKSTPLGPVMVTPDEIDHAARLELGCDVDGVEMQRSNTSDLVFSPEATVAYISQFTTLRAGDVVLMGTPGGVGSARDPKIFLQPGQVLRTTIDGIGECLNTCREESA